MSRHQSPYSVAREDDLAGQLEDGRILDGKWEIVNFVAAGGMGFVYKARHVETGELAALKVLRAFLGIDDQAIKRFQREAVTIARLEHDNIVRLLDHGASPEGLMYIAMEWLEGLNLAEVLAQHGVIKPMLAAWIGAAVARGLIDSHSKGIIHRDLKPENIILIQENVAQRMVKVLDFGIAKIGQEGGAVTRITQMGSVCGTPEYMSPEQAKGDDLDGRSDIYGLGCLLYALITGTLPFTGANPLQILMGHLTKAFPEIPEEVPTCLRTIILRAVSKDRDERYPSALEMADALDLCVLRCAGSVEVPAIEAEDSVADTANVGDTVAAVLAVQQSQLPHHDTVFDANIDLELAHTYVGMEGASAEMEAWRPEESGVERSTEEDISGVNPAFLHKEHGVEPGPDATPPPSSVKDTSVMKFPPAEVMEEMADVFSSAILEPSEPKIDHSAQTWVQLRAFDNRDEETSAVPRLHVPPQGPKPIPQGGTDRRLLILIAIVGTAIIATFTLLAVLLLT